MATVPASFMVSPARNLIALPERADPLALTPRRWRVLGILAAALMVAGVVGLIAMPTGASAASDVIPDGDRVEATATVRGARVMVLSRNGRLRLFVAYERNEGWHGVEVQPPPPDSALAWAATRGGSGVPALSAVYGRTPAASVQVTWADGSKTAGAIKGDAWLVTRPGHVRSASVTVFAADGAVVSTVDGP